MKYVCSMSGSAWCLDCTWRLDGVAVSGSWELYTRHVKYNPTHRVRGLNIEEIEVENKEEPID